MTHKQFIISIDRSDNCLTADWNTEATIITREDQVEDYKKFYNNEIIGVPKELDGSPSKARNYVLNHFKNQNVVIFDDDIKGIGYHENRRKKYVGQSYLKQFIDDMFLMCEDLGTIQWGVNVAEDEKFYHEYTPFSLKSVVLGPFTAIRNIDPLIRYDEDLFLKEDFDLFLQIMNKYRKVLRNNKWFYTVRHIDMAGGITSIRTSDREKEHAKQFQKKWGSKIVNINRKTQHGGETINPILKVPIKGV
jgi:hypothetical protein